MLILFELLCCLGNRLKFFGLVLNLARPQYLKQPHVKLENVEHCGGEPEQADTACLLPN